MKDNLQFKYFQLDSTMPYTHDLHFIDIRRIHFFPSSLILLASALFHNRNNDPVQNNIKFEYFDLGAHLPSAKIIMDLFLCVIFFVARVFILVVILTVVYTLLV